MTDLTTDVAALQAEMRAFRADPPPLLPLDAAFGCNRFATDTPARSANAAALLAFQRFVSWRDAGYWGPLAPDGTIPDPDDPAQHAALVTAAQHRAVDREAMEADL